MTMKYLNDSNINILTSAYGNYDDVSLTNLRGFFTAVDSTGITEKFKSVNGLTRNKC